MIVFYTASCEGCSGNRALANMKVRCEKAGLKFQERRTIFFYVFENEANGIMKKAGVKLPFFYGTESGNVLVGNSFTPLDDIDKLIDAELEAQKGKDEETGL